MVASPKLTGVLVGFAVMLMADNAGAISVELAKKCSALTAETYPPRVIGNHAAGRERVSRVPHRVTARRATIRRFQRELRRRDELRPGFPELPENQHYPLLQGAKDENKGIVGTWEVDVIDTLRPMSNEPIVINFGSDSFEGTDLDRLLRAANVGHLFVSGQCIEHVVATTIKRAANMGYNPSSSKTATSGFTDNNYSAMLDILPLYRAGHRAQPLHADHLRQCRLAG